MVSISHQALQENGKRNVWLQLVQCYQIFQIDLSCNYACDKKKCFSTNYHVCADGPIVIFWFWFIRRRKYIYEETRQYGKYN